LEHVFIAIIFDSLFSLTYQDNFINTSLFEMAFSLIGDLS
jgi:hypothetical protein